MGFDEGRVVFDRPDLTYSPGQVVQGRLEFQQDKDKTFRGIYVKAKGFCETHWETRETRRVDDREEVFDQSHDAYELYFEQVVYLVGGKSGECHIKPGEHVFPFQVLIPPHCPSSYEGRYGHIRYTFKFVVDRAFKIDQEKQITITVVSPYDLNKNPYCLEPIVFKFDEPYSCCCVSQGRVETFVKVPRAGFCPGETMPIEMSCQNDSKLKIDLIQCKIKENRVYRTTDDSKYIEDTIATLTKSSIPGNTSRQWELQMVVPQMELHNLEGCSWIEIYYDFEVKVSPEGCHSDSDASSRIILGHIPLRIGEPDTMMPIQQPALNPAPYPQTFPYSGPYPGGNKVYPPAGNGPYSDGNVPYPGGNVPFTGGNGPYPARNEPYPGGNPPNPNVPYPGGNIPYPGENVPYPEGNIALPGGSPGNVPKPGKNAPYPGGHVPYPGGFAPSPVGNVPYPDGNGPDGNALHPSGNGNVPYPAGHAPGSGGNVPYLGGNVPYPRGNIPHPAGNAPFLAGNQEKAPFLQEHFQKTPCPVNPYGGFTVPADNQETSPQNEGADLTPQPPYNPNVEKTPLLQDKSQKSSPAENHEKSPETSNPKYEAPQQPYNPNMPSGATPYNPNMTSSATPYNPNMPSGATPYNPNMPSGATPYNPNMPSPYNPDPSPGPTRYPTVTPYPVTVMPVPMRPLPHSGTDSKR